MKRRGIYQWAVEYCGDPASHQKRGDIIVDFLRREGLEPHHKVLDVGCGALSQGKPLIEFLDSGNYVGLDPNGWLIEAAIEEFPHLLNKNPEFSFNNEFSTGKGPFDFVVAHSVLSHVAQWQVDLAAQRIREEVEKDAIFLASVRLTDEDTLDRTWQYPGNSFFRFGTLLGKVTHAGWTIEHVADYKEIMVQSCPNDIHDWVRMRAVMSPRDINSLVQEAEARDREDKEILEIAKQEYRRRCAEQ